MGLKSSPHGCIEMQALAEEVIRGNPADRRNPFYYDKVILNLPGSQNYNPAKAWLYKFHSDAKAVACDVVTYVDDLRLTGSTRERCRAICHLISTRFAYLGIQDALRKCSDPSPNAGVWTGSSTQTMEGMISVSCTQEKWEKAKAYIRDIQQRVQQGEALPFKVLEQQRDFLVYISRTYPLMVPNLKGIHLTLDSWMPH